MILRPPPARRLGIPRLRPSPRSEPVRFSTVVALRSREARRPASQQVARAGSPSRHAPTLRVSGGPRQHAQDRPGSHEQPSSTSPSPSFTAIPASGRRCPSPVPSRALLRTSSTPSARTSNAVTFPADLVLRERTHRSGSGAVRPGGSASRPLIAAAASSTWTCTSRTAARRGHRTPSRHGCSARRAPPAAGMRAGEGGVGVERRGVARSRPASQGKPGRSGSRRSRCRGPRRR